MTKTGEQLLFQDMGLPDVRKPSSEWTEGQRQALYVLVTAVIERLDLDPDTGLRTVWVRMCEALSIGELDLDDVINPLFVLADQRRGGRIQ